MPYSRYTGRPVFLNKDRNYKKVFFENRDIEQTYQYTSPRFSFPDAAVIQGLNNTLRVWGATDKLYNVSAEFYGSPEYWWVIAWYNHKASEAEFKVGELYYIPQPLEDVLGYVS